MEQWIQDFNRQVKMKKHLLELFQVAPSMSILTGNGGQLLLIEMNFTNKNESNGEKILLKGKIDSFRELLSGKKKLRMLAEQGHLELACSFRDLLKLETIFYLVHMETSAYSKN